MHYKINKITMIGRYLSLIVGSGLLYAYVTTRLIYFGFANTFTVILISAFLDMLLFFFLWKWVWLSGKQAKFFASVGMIAIGIYSLFFKEENAAMIIITYTVATFLISFILLDIEKKVLAENVKKGLVTITFFRNFAKLIGFTIGALFFYIPINWLIILLFFLFFTFLFDKTIASNKRTNTNIISFEKIKEKKQMIYLALLSSTTVFWIPLLVAHFALNRLVEWSFIAYTWPGITTMIALPLYRRYQSYNKFLSYVYIFLLLLFSISLLYPIPFIQTSIFGLVVAHSTLLTINVRQAFIQANQSLDSKLLLQTFNVISSICLLFFTLLAMVSLLVPYFLLVMNIVAACFIIQEKGEK